MGKIIVVGSINMDLVVRAPRHPRPGETLLGSDFQTFPGGKGANQAVAAARLGADVKMIGRVGQDAFGGQLLEGMRADGINVSQVQSLPGQATGVALITLDQNGQNTIVVASGANMSLTRADVLAAEDLFADAAVLLTQLEVPVDAVQASLELAKKHGLVTMLNPAPARELPANLLKLVDFLIPNESELALLAGGQTDIDAAARTLHGQGVENLIVTLGGDGVRVDLPAGAWLLPAYSVKVVDTVAAGDAFAGAFCAALSEGKSVEDAVGWANAAGALAVTRAGAQPSLPNRMELQEFLRQAA
jgi:ribokinase